MNTAPDTRLGVHLLESITSGMYSQPLHCVREYIQNAFDSIRDSRRSKLLGHEEGRIKIFIDQQKRSLRICDNGKGLGPEEASVKLVDIGRSDKAASSDKASTNAGFRGIGRMAGISYCDRLVFTTCNGDGQVSTIAFDAQKIKQLAQPGQLPVTMKEAIDKNCDVKCVKSGSSTQFLEVSLERVTNDALLDFNTLSNYLEQTAPVRNDRTKWKFDPQITTFAESAAYPESLDAVSIHVCNFDGAVNREIYRPFKNTFETKDGKGKNPRRVEVESLVALPRKGDYKGWWGWLALHERRGALADVSFCGLRVRMHNIAVGDETLLQELWTTQSLAKWCFGELHVVDPDLVPNSQRDNFEASEGYSRFREQLRDEIRSIEREIRNESSKRNASVDKFVQNAEKVTNKAQHKIENGLASHNEKEQIIEDLDQHADKLNSKLRGRNLTDEEKSKLEEVLDDVEQLSEKLEKVRRTDADASMSHLDKKARNAVRTVLEVVERMLKDKKLFNEIERQVFDSLRPGRRNR